MRCPYCTSNVVDEALVCPHCTRDLYLFKPLLERLAGLEKAVAEQAKVDGTGIGARMAALEAELAEFKKAIPSEPSANRLVGESAAKPAFSYSKAVPMAILLALVLLVAAHWVLLFVFDVRPLYLRIATILIPVPIGFLLGSHYPGRVKQSVGAGFVVALGAVCAMLVVTSGFDKVPILPQDARDFRETLEYVLSIGLAFATGVLLGLWLPASRQEASPPNRVLLALARAVTPAQGGRSVEQAAKKIDDLLRTATPVATAAASAYAGVRAFLDAIR